MLKRCSNCMYCVLDWKAMMLGIYAHECYKKKHVIINPFWKGWGCKLWEKEYGK